MEEMTVPLDTVNDIRSMDAAGRSRSEIARVLHVSRNTVAKYADMEDMSPAAPMPQRRGRPALEGNEEWVIGVLEADLGAPRKHRQDPPLVCARQGGLRQEDQDLLHKATRPRGPLAREPRPARRRAEAAAEVRGVRPARNRRVAAREAGRAVQGDAVGAFRTALREGIDRPVHAVQKEGLAPEARRRRARGRDHGPHRPQCRLGRDGRHEHAAGNGGKESVA